MSYKESELVLKVSKNVNPKNWDEGFYQTFLDLIFKNRTYQKEATEITLRFMNSGEYNCVSDLAKENFEKNEVIRTRFNNNFDAFKNDLDLPNKLSATLDLATGTGKSYVMIAIALIMLASKKVTRVLVLVPSLTIESELTNKFKDILSDEQLIKTLGSDFKTPELLNGDSTIVENSIAIENRDAIYKAQMDKNSITDSLSGHGETTLVLNDEAHHVYYSDNNEWKKFITDKNDYGIDFKYIVGLTGTPYKSRTKNGSSNEYLSDVIYRYSLRDAIEQGFVKDVEYISKEDMPRDKNDRWQVILNSHDNIAKKLENTLGEKPITIVITNTTAKSDSQAKAFKQFLKKSRNLSDNEIDNIVLSVHSKPSAASDRLKLKKVDQHNNPVEFIFSVAMLTEGWDVKRVFQIVPDDIKISNKQDIKLLNEQNKNNEITEKLGEIAKEKLVVKADNPVEAVKKLYNGNLQYAIQDSYTLSDISEKEADYFRKTATWEDVANIEESNNAIKTLGNGYYADEYIDRDDNNPHSANQSILKNHETEHPTLSQQYKNLLKQVQDPAKSTQQAEKQLKQVRQDISNQTQSELKTFADNNPTHKQPKIEKNAPTI